MVRLEDITIVLAVFIVLAVIANSESILLSMAHILLARREAILAYRRTYKEKMIELRAKPEKTTEVTTIQALSFNVHRRVDEVDGALVVVREDMSTGGSTFNYDGCVCGPYATVDEAFEERSKIARRMMGR